MRAMTMIHATLIYLPFDVFAHASHVEWSLSSLAGRFELIEASLVIAAVAIYLLSGHKNALKISRIKLKRHKK